MNSIEVRCALKSYNCKNFVLNGLNLTLSTGSVYGLIGASGCGKTTLLSCILGMKQLDKGRIKVFGQEVSYEKPSKFSHLIGYMPQETALVGELTVKETLYFFGNIFQMNASLLSIRYKMICDLLELMDENKLVEDLSGGEKRRISLAAAVIHDPQILILDEPTVGLDSILRDKIWTFLIENTKSKNLSVLITTHYIAEAEKCDQCGLMRNGVLLAEDSPTKIINHYGAASLEEAFVLLCLLKTKRNNENLSCFYDTETILRNSGDLKSIEANTENVDKKDNDGMLDKRKKFSTQTLKALFVKEFSKVKRQPAQIFYMFIFPIIQIFCFAFAVGKNPNGLKIGIVNNEINDAKFCTEYLRSTNFTFSSNLCYFENLSCYLLNEIQDSTATKIYYNSFDQAFRDAKAGLTSGLISIDSNFTILMSERKFDWQPMTEKANDSNIIQVYLNHEDSIIASFLQHRFFKAFERLNKKMLRQCELNDALEDSSLNIDQGLLYGTFDDDYTMTIMPGLFAQVILLGGILCSVSTISQCRVEGVWNRILLAGVTTTEILLVYIILLIIADIIQIVLFHITIWLLFDLTFIGSKLLFALFCMGISMVGSSIGLIISVHINDLLVINTASIVTFFTCGCLCGAFWPLEAQPHYLRMLSYIIPTTIPSISMKDILAKGLELSHPIIYGGLIVLVIWLVITQVICFVSLKRHRYTETKRLN